MEASTAPVRFLGGKRCACRAAERPESEETVGNSRLDAGTTDMKQFISFSIGEEQYGLDILRVREIIRLREITWLPRAPSFLKGVINLRGDVIPVIDLRDKFGLEQRPYDETTRVIVVEVGGKLVGMVVDSVSQVVRIPAEQIEPTPTVAGLSSADCIDGVAKVKDELVMLLDADKLLTAEDGSAIAAASAVAM
jgi:purine-binding chemotaxis protein CheW